jgi:hypothetical protein
MAQKFTILRKIGDGQIIPIVRFDKLSEALQLAAKLNEHWPAEYFIRGPEGNVMAAKDAA